MLLLFIGCTNNTNLVSNEKFSNEELMNSKDKEFDELDKIESQMKDELSPGTNAVKQINFKVCK